MSRAVLVLVVATLAAPQIVVAKKRATPCAPGVFVVADDARLAPLGDGPVTIAVAADGQVTVGTCAAAKGKVKADRRATTVSARVRNCGGKRALRISLRIASPGCTMLSGGIFGLRGRRVPLAATRSTLHVQTAGGIVRGRSVDGVRTFFGIPYAAPPVGDLRWRAPAPAVPWTGVRDGTKAGSFCPQSLPVLGNAGSEDCLFANVFTPDPPPTTPAPVMVWIHGGAFTIGDSRQIIGGTDGDLLARTAGVVVVTVNYRLGELGFLAHRALSAEDAAHPTSGNYGFEDQVAALGWVRDNVAAFGGDPANVTIFGESAGGWSVCAHLASPKSAGLFHRAIVESGLCIVPFATRARAETQGDRFAELLGCSGAADVLACMRGKSVAAVRAALPPDPSYVFSPGEWGTWQPTVDGVDLPQQTQAALSSGAFNHVPVLIGSNRDEGNLFIAQAFDDLGTPVMAADYPTVLGDFLPAPVVTPATGFYPLGSYASPSYAAAAVFGDALFACPTIGTARLLAAQTPTYLYQFEFPDAAFPLPSAIPLGATHSAEIQYVFGHRAGPGPGFSPVEQTLSSAMMGYWTRFAASGDPNGGGAVAWPPLDAGSHHLVIDTTISAGTAAKQAACEFWASQDYLRPRLQ